MKRFTLLVILVAAFAGLNAQSNKVVTAWNLIKPEYNELDKAKEAIDQAAQHPKTSAQAKTWYYRGLVYYKLYQTKEEKFKNLDPNPLKVAYESFVRGKELDVKNRYEEQIVFRLTMAAAEFFNKGTYEFEQKNFKQSLESFETALAIGQLPYINQMDTSAYFNAGIAADQGGEYDKAVEYYKQAIEYNYGGPEVFKYLSDVYEAKGDTATAISSLKDGIAKFPDTSTNLMIDLINYYLGVNRLEEARIFIEKALDKEADNASLWFVYGHALEQSEDIDKAVDAYIKATEVDSTYFDAWFNLGTIFFNQGVSINDAAANIPLDDEEGYKKAVAEVDAFFHRALPYYEKAYEINPQDANLLNGLKNIYYRFKMNEKFAEIEKIINDLK